ncbi:SDR family oxidoreductase [Microscilla marina]|uniref:Dehydrogenase/reductase SDR family member 9 n=1 Tax=Microscilla marina ATCC 23134 TaxID=313606 RepID=A1ZYN0_MICM2|nr:SDR family oxidoreductase [Microscilla marina]EAY24533.1 dehydrogenase/reductase SDR family member 9 [Microscilla marina ATCC 23134]
MKTILITGASTGIGYGCVKEFHQRGYQVLGSVRKQADADKLSSEFGDRFIPLLFDVSNPEAIQQAVQQVEQILGNEQGLAGLINNAGIALGGPLALQPMSDIRQHFEVNVFGLIQVTQAFLPLLGARKNHPVAPGKILNISSVGGKVGAPFIGAYVATKHAVEGLSQSWRRELLLYGIDVILIGPGSVKTPIWDKGINPAPYDDTDYETALHAFAQMAQDGANKGLTVEHLGKRIARIFEKRTPKTRYAIVPQKFKNWTLPRLLPDRVIDGFFKKIMKKR